MPVRTNAQEQDVESRGEVYDTPATYFVNQFVGTANVFPGKLEAVDGANASARVRLFDGSALETRAPVDALAVGSNVFACVRPENLRLGAQGDGVAATVELGMPLGATIVHEIRTAGGARMKLAEPREPGTTARPAGAAVWVKPVSPASVIVFAAP